MKININDNNTFEDKWWHVELECDMPNHNNLNSKYFAKTNVFTLSFVIEAKDEAQARNRASEVAYQAFIPNEDISSIKMLNRKICAGGSSSLAELQNKLNAYNLV
jgi:hypothetical protein